jgi:ABC-type sugar transport system substrate-binding protein
MASRPDIQPCRVALFLRDESDYQDVLRDDCAQVARRYGFPLLVSAADNDPGRQLDSIQYCLARPEAERPNVILVSPVRETSLLPAAHAAARMGIGWVLLGRWCPYVASLRAEFSQLPIFAVLADQREIGRIQGRQAKALLPLGGELVYIRGPLSTFSATQRSEGLQESLQGTRIKLFALTSDWSIDGGKRAMNEWLQVCQRRECPKLVVSAQNDAMAIGARSALEEAARRRLDTSLQRVPVTGCDGSPDYGRRLVMQGRLKATVVMPPSAGKAVHEIAAMPPDGHARPPAEVILTPTSFPELEALGRAR